MTPSVYYGESYESYTSNRAKQLGYDVLDFVVGKNGLGRNSDYREWGKYSGPVPAVSFYPSGDFDVGSPTNQINTEETSNAHSQWVNFIENVAETVGYKLVDFVGSEKSIRKKDEQGDENLVDKNTIDSSDTETNGDVEIEKGVEGHALKESKIITEGGATDI